MPYNCLIYVKNIAVYIIANIKENKMEIDVNDSGEYLVIKIWYERLDVSVMQETKDKVMKLIEGKDKIILDLSNINFLDSSGLSVLITILKHLNNVENSDLKLCGLNEQPTELMQITQLNNVFTIVDNCDN